MLRRLWSESKTFDSSSPNPRFRAGFSIEKIRWNFSPGTDRIFSGKKKLGDTGKPPIFLRESP
jgi:hypothetical protein